MDPPPLSLAFTADEHAFGRQPRCFAVAEGAVRGRLPSGLSGAAIPWEPDGQLEFFSGHLETSNAEIRSRFSGIRPDGSA